MIKTRFGMPLIKAIAVASPQDVAAAHQYWDLADIMLFDAKPDPATALPGGNGMAFDWGVLSGLQSHKPFALSGGLTPENVGEAIKLTGAVMVDVSSGVERKAGQKDLKLIQSFIRAAKAVTPQARAKAS
jgi:phosphoribosylanthranilate isomerase